MNNITAIVYTSNTGFTARYATLLGEGTRLPFYTLDEARRQLPSGAPVVYLGWLCAGGLKGYRKAAGRYHVQAACAVGMAPTGQNSLEELSQRIKAPDLPLFYLQGGYAPSRLTGIYKCMMSIMGRAVGKAPAETEVQQAMQQAFVHGGDWVSPEQLAPVLDWMGLLS